MTFIMLLNIWSTELTTTRRVLKGNIEKCDTFQTYELTLDIEGVHSIWSYCIDMCSDT